MHPRDAVLRGLFNRPFTGPSGPFLSSGGSTFKTYAITQTVVFSQMARRRDIDGRLCYVLDRNAFSAALGKP